MEKLAQIGLSFLALSSLAMADQPCQPMEFGEDSFVCVCDSSYCDEPDPVVVPPPGQLLHVTSSASGDRFRSETLDWDSRPAGGDDGRLALEVDASDRRQEIFGWGGAFTDAATMVIDTMDQGAQEQILKAYFDPSVGLNYNTGRINMGGCDFSTRGYTYCDQEGDVELESFALQEEDLEFKIPYVKRANEYRPEPLQLFASPWTAPKWMKSNNDYSGQGYLLPEYYSAWANYFVKFFQEYEKEGVTFWGVTAQNEPLDGNIPDFSFNCMGWNASTQSEFVAEHLGPAMEEAGYGDVDIMIFDDQRPLAPHWVEEVFEDERNLDFVSGVAVHWYVDEYLGLPNALDRVHEEFPDKFILYTEACNGDVGPDVLLGDWHRGETYLDNMIEDVNHWSVGWTDWNLALDMEGGPNWTENFVDSPIIVDADAGVFYKQPMFYALGHVTRFLDPGSTVVSVLPSDEDDGDRRLQYTAAERPDGAVAFVVLNRGEDTKFVSLVDPVLGHLKRQTMLNSSS